VRSVARMQPATAFLKPQYASEDRPWFGFWVLGLGFGVGVLGFGVLGFGIWDLGFRV
jgi:hypothetical protein